MEKRNERMNILIIGNGFDLAHDLPTKYENFLDFTNVYLGKTCFDSEYIDSFREYFERIKQTAPSVYEEIGSLIKDNVWLEHFNAVYEERRKEGKIGWIDFESEISNAVQALDGAISTIDEYLRKGKDQGRMEAYQFESLKYLIGHERDRFSNVYFDMRPMSRYREQFLDDLNKLTRCLEIYLSDYINNLPVSKRLPDILGLKVDKVLSFNYTNTYEMLYGKDNPDIEYDYIHGKADINHDINSCNLVLGIDEYLPEGEKDQNIEFIQFKKFYQRIYKKTGCKYLDWISKHLIQLHEMQKSQKSSLIIAEALQVYIFGHSLDNTDKDILKELIMTENTITKIFHFNQEALGKQIANLVKVIGQDNLISMVHGKHARIVLQQQQDAKNVEVEKKEE